ncbi:hypothetical protein GCM10020219_069270 [Nonomuraea dietziae]
MKESIVSVPRGDGQAVARAEQATVDDGGGGDVGVWVSTSRLSTRPSAASATSSRAAQLRATGRMSRLGGSLSATGWPKGWL